MHLCFTPEPLYPCTLVSLQNVVDFSSPEVQAQGKDLLDGVIRSYALLDEALLHAMQVRCFTGA